jgi:Asp/Glu/hydantoin racemase
MTNYGEVLGILMLDTLFPRIPGDIGNASSFSFPVKYHMVRNATPERIAAKTDPALLEPFVEAAKELEKEGVRAITTSCGFLALWQKELAAAVSIPVLTSSLLQVPLAWQLTGKRPVGIITAKAGNLSEAHLTAVGIENIPVFLAGLDDAPEFTRTFIRNTPELNVEAVRAEVIERATELVREHPEIGAIVLECTNLPPYSNDIRAATGRPVFDVMTLCRYAAQTVGTGPVGNYL